MAEFYARMQQGVGQFLARGEIDAANATSLFDLMRTFKSVLVTEDPNTGAITVGSLRSRCPMQIYVDGVPVTGKFLPPPPSTIAGIEVYSGAATIPLEFKRTGGSWCGVVIVWTRDGS